MIHALKAAAAALALLASSASVLAADYEVRMLNVGPDEKTMVFEPPLLHVQRGDTVTFVPTDRGHNAASMEGMIPRGAAPWQGAISEPVSVTFEVDGTYGYICEPHYGLGMVGLVLVGDYTASFRGCAVGAPARPRRPALQGPLRAGDRYAARPSDRSGSSAATRTRAGGYGEQPRGGPGGHACRAARHGACRGAGAGSVAYRRNRWPSRQNPAGRFDATVMAPGRWKIGAEDESRDRS